MKSYRPPETHYKWSGGRIIDSKGYIEVRCDNHPKALSHGKYVKEHRLVMEKHLGRYLEDWEDVHHINGDKQDNIIGNLELISHDKHASLTQTGNKYWLGKKHSEETKQKLRESHNPNSNLVGRHRKK